MRIVFQRLLASMLSFMNLLICSAVILSVLGACVQERLQLVHLRLHL